MSASKWASECAEDRHADCNLAESLARFGDTDEWHVEIDKSLAENEMGEKGLSCLDGVEQRPIFGKEA
jgi:hypothetical protein